MSEKTKILKQELLEISEKRDKIDQEIKETIEVINAFETDGFDKPLVDDEGFPRKDIDYGRLSEYKTQKKKQEGMLKRTFK